jgi:hypothetical protein
MPVNEPCAGVKPMPCQQQYRQLHSKCGSIAELSFSTRSLYSENYSYAKDFEDWFQILSERPEALLLKFALREYQHALFAVVQGQYRYAYAGLRLFLELCLRSVYFSAEDLRFRLWLKGEQDINWEALVCEETGIFSRTFVGAYNGALSDEAGQYNELARLLYRECSEYIHGNACTYEILPDEMEFREKVFLDWQEKAQTARLTVSFALCFRYLEAIAKTDLLRLEPAILDELGHIPSIRAFFEKPPE